MCSYTPLFPTNPPPGDPIYGVHWCELGKSRRKACPMPSYDVPTPTRALSPSDPAVIKTTTYGYDYADARPSSRRLERRFTDFDFEPRSSRKHAHSGGSGDRHRKRMYVDDGPLGLRFVKSSTSRRKDRDHVVIIDRRDKHKERRRDDRDIRRDDLRREDREVRREDREVRREERATRPEFEYSSKSRRNSLSRDALSREALLGRSSTGLDDEFYTSTSTQVYDDATRVTTASSSRRKYDDGEYEYIDAVPKDSHHEEDSRRRSKSGRYPDDYKRHSRGVVEIEKANSSSRRPGRSSRYLEDHLRDPMRRSDLDRAEEELARQRKRTSYPKDEGFFEPYEPKDEGFFEPYEPKENKRVSGSYSRADLDRAYDEYEAAVGGGKREEKKYDEKKYDEKKYDKPRYDDDRREKRDNEKRDNYEKYNDDKKYEKAAAKAKYEQDRYAEKEADREHSRSSRYGGSAAAVGGAAAAAAALGPSVFDATSRFDDLEKSGKYADFDMEAYEKEHKYAVKDPREEYAKYGKANKYDDYEKYDKHSSDYEKYDKRNDYKKYDDKQKYGAVFDDELADIEAVLQRNKMRRSSSASSYHKPTVEEVDDDDKANRHNKRSAKYAPGEEPLFGSPSSSPPPSKAELVSKRDRSCERDDYASSKRDRSLERDEYVSSKSDRIDREAHQDLASSSLKVEDAEIESMLERRLETARMRAEILRMKEMQEVEAQAERMRRPESSVRAIEAPRDRDDASRLRRSSSLKRVSWGDDM